MPSASQRKWLVIFKRQPTTENEYGEQTDSGDPTEVARQRVSVRFGTAQEQRQAAQEKASQTATFECVRTVAVEAVLITDFVEFDGSDWDITERAPLDNKTIRFTGVRNV